MHTCVKWNKDWQFSKQPLSAPECTPDLKAASWSVINLPHDWLIANSSNHYEDSEGWYLKSLTLTDSSSDEFLLYFEGVYMDCSVYVNDTLAGEWKYGYTSFEVRLTPYLKAGENRIFVRVRYASPNTRWYSGAGIYRNVWLKTVPALHIASHGIATETKQEQDHWQLTVHTTLEQAGKQFPADASSQLWHCLETIDGTVIVPRFADNTTLTLTDIIPWGPSAPQLYRVVSVLEHNGTIAQQEETVIGFRTITLSPDDGFLINGTKMKLYGVCQHHDLGALGSAVNRSALRRQLLILMDMGVNAIRTSHNPPAVELLELADELGLLIIDEAFDMWERSKTTYDYARFFPEWSRRDVESWITRDRNHPCVVMWSIGNEIYDTHVDDHGQELTRYLMELVEEFDPYHHAASTIGSNYMSWENAQKCADIIKLAGYNYTEKLYQQHHEAHPDWIIYGSETSSTVQSRGIYHFPLAQPTLAEDDLQCSSLGNSTTSWGAKSQQFCALAERASDFSLGQFLWSGFDYIGEPTPYHTRNSYFGQIDTAGFPKDAFYFYQSVWTDVKEKPMVHILPYWDFNEGQQIDVRVYSNAPQVELFVNGVSQGRQTLEHFTGDHIIADWQVPYQAGSLTAIAYDSNGTVIARDECHSFGDAAALRLTADRCSVPADGQELIFVTIDALDQDGFPVANANNRIHVEVSGAGTLVGLDNGDSSDYDPYKGSSRYLFSGKLLAMVAPTLTPGSITITARSEGLQEAVLTVTSTACALPEDACSICSITDPLAGSLDAKQEIPIRKLELVCEADRELTPEHTSARVHLMVHPSNATYDDISWKIVNAGGVPITNASLEVVNSREVIVHGTSDGQVYLRCLCKNGRQEYAFYSQLEFTVSGMGMKNLNPYEFLSGSLYHSCTGEVSNGNEHGISTSRDSETTVTFGPLDFGSFGSDTVTIPIFELESKPTYITFLDGDTELGTYCYDKKSIWNVYQEQTFVFPKRLTGVSYLTLRVNHKIHIKGICFEKQEKAWAELSALNADAIYGDTFCREADAVTGIGNNVSLEFNDMDFGTCSHAVLELTGRCPIDKNTIHVRMIGAQDTVLNIAEFTHTKDYETQRFQVDVLPGTQKVIFLFLPGCDFDFRSFHFLPEA